MAEQLLSAFESSLDKTNVILKEIESAYGWPKERRNQSYAALRTVLHLRLARALVADPETLILVEPTSAVDAHTEARIAERLGPARRGRTTLVCTTSPLVLGHADHVVFVEDGKVVAEGRHEELLATEPRYAATVSREEDR